MTSAPSFEDRRRALEFIVAHLGKDRAAASLSPSEWAAVPGQLAEQKVGSLAYGRLLEGPAAAGMPDAVRAEIRKFYALGKVRSVVVSREAGAAIEGLGRAGIPVMVLKGVHLAAAVYPDPGQRTMWDIDLMVRRDQLARAEAVFVELGYGPIPRPDIEESCQRSNHIAALIKPKALPLEIHWTIERPTSPFTIDIDALWRRARPVWVGGVEALGLAPEDLLLHLSLHAAYHHRYDRAALKGLVDIDAVVARHGETIDWNQLTQTANTWGAGPFVYTTLRLAATLLHTLIPEAALVRLERSDEDERVVDVARQYILTPELELPPAYKEMRESATVMGRASTLTRNVFLPKDQLRKLYGLREGSPLVYGYYAVRVVDVVVRRGRLALQLLFKTHDVQPSLNREASRQRIEGWVEAGGRR